MIVINDVVYWADQPGTGDGNLDACQAQGVSPCNDDAGLSVLRTNGTGVSTRLFGSDTTNLYWVENDQTGGAIFLCPLNCTTSPSSPIATSTTTISAFTVLKTSVGSLPVGALVWATVGQQLWSCVPGGSSCPATLIGTIDFTPVSTYGGDSKTPPLITGNGAVNQLECTTAGCSIAALFPVPNDTTASLNTDNSNIYVATAGGTIYAAARNNGFALTMLASGQGQINGLASDGRYLYWTSSNGIVGGVAK
jgi:hypothetical protein